MSVIRMLDLHFKIWKYSFLNNLFLRIQKDDWNALQLAVSIGEIDETTELLLNRADVNFQIKVFSSAFHCESFLVILDHNRTKLYPKYHPFISPVAMGILK